MNANCLLEKKRRKQKLYTNRISHVNSVASCCNFSDENTCRFSFHVHAAMVPVQDCELRNSETAIAISHQHTLPVGYKQ